MAVAQTGAIFKTLTFDNTSSRTYGVYITGEAVYNAPERDVSMISIPGKNGALVMDYGRFQNIEVTYPAGIFASTEADFRQAISDFRNFLCSKTTYVKLTDDYNPDEYRMAVYKSGLEVEPAQLRAGEFNIVFDCKPQRFLTSGDTEWTAGTSITNPTLFPSRPLITTSGAGTTTINGTTVTVTGSGTVYIDCDSMEIYTLSGQTPTSAASRVSFSGNEFPTLKAGANSVSKSGLSSVKIKPRWWKV